jgi:putative DNA methylase
LVPASRFRPKNGPEEKRESLGRANAAKFVERLCKYPGSPQVVAEAQRHILEAHADRLTAELKAAKSGEKPAWAEEFKFTGQRVTVDDIVDGRAPRPRVLDMFAGGGSIPLEALRLGCEAYALELNPVAHIIELCTLVYPQKYGKPDASARGMTGPKNEKGETTWGGLAEEVRYWGNWVLEKVKSEIRELYPLVPDPEYKGERPTVQTTMWQPGRKKDDVPLGYLVPIAYLWTRTVRCKNPSCGATVPLVRQTWLCKKKGHYVALTMVAPTGQKQARFDVVESTTEAGLGFDPASFSKGGNATCRFCPTVADSDYVKAEGCAKRMGHQMMAVVCRQPSAKGKVYLSADNLPQLVPEGEEISQRIAALCERTALTVPYEPIETNPRSMDTQHFGFETWGDLFTPRQMLCLLTFAAAVRQAEGNMRDRKQSEELARRTLCYLATAVNREAEDSSSLCRWNPIAEKMQGTFGRQALPMVWDFCEVNPFGRSVGDWLSLVDLQVNTIEGTTRLSGMPSAVARGSATALPWPDGSLDAVVTDPPYYDNVSYSNLSDFFYVWLKRTVGSLYPEHFASVATPKKSEVIAAFYRHGGDKRKSRAFYEEMMVQALREAHRVLKPGGELVVVYAHKTTLGWATLVNALRQAGFVVTEAWPLDTEMKSRLIAMETAALASSIFLVARKRDATQAASLRNHVTDRLAAGPTGNYEQDVQPDLEQIVRERVETLWEMGVSGADLLIAAIGAGLRAFTRFSRVEYANGEEVPAEKFLAEVEGVVLETLLEKIFGVTGSGVAAVDGPSRFYVLWRYTYKAGEMDAGEAIVFTYGQNVELDGQNGLSAGSRALIEKKKGKYRLRDFSERGQDEKLGLPGGDGNPAPLIDALHRILWLMENEPRNLGDFLEGANVDLERLRLIAQVLAGAALKGMGTETDQHTVVTTAAEQSALQTLTANWRSLIESRMRKRGETLI